jgi:predicted RNase H-related nuclease YkuK (DUF458 family)
MNLFKTIQGKPITDILGYTLDIIKKDPKVKIYIGTDSQKHSRKVTYVTCIAYRNSFGRGVHVIYRIVNHKRPKGIGRSKVHILERLTKEVEMTMELADFFRQESNVKISFVEFDLNEDEKYPSSALVNMATGWARGMGLTPIIKPSEMCAVKAANELCR